MKAAAHAAWMLGPELLLFDKLFWQFWKLNTKSILLDSDDGASDGAFSDNEENETEAGESLEY